MRTIKLVLEYDGAGFAGWQVQPGQRTIQAELEAALFKLTGERIKITASGRTDAGVHARGQVVSFRTESGRTPRVFKNALNALLPAEVAVLSAAEAPARFHARQSARGKWYRYLIVDRPGKEALERGRVWRIPRKLDVAAMREAAGCLVGVHDFQSFRSASCEAATSVREMRRIEIFRDGRERIVIEMWASAFLKQMVRAIVGTLVEVGSGKRSPQEMKEILEARDRTRAGMTAPPQGLYLVKVDYAENMEETKP